MRKQNYQYEETPDNDGYIPNDPPQNLRDEIELRIRDGNTLKDQIDQWRNDEAVERFINLIKKESGTVDTSPENRLDLY